MESPIRVLLVDDELRFCEVMSKRLKKRGFAAEFVCSAEEAIKVVRQKAFDVVVLDFLMGGMDGMTALSQVKRLAPEIQVIMLTGHGTRYAATRAMVKDAFDYLAKPCDADVLASRIRDARAEKNRGFCFDRRKAADIMAWIENLETIPTDVTVGEAIVRMTKAACPARERFFFPVLDGQKNLAGILTVRSLLKALRPEYTRTPDGSGGNSHRFSPVFWNGYFMTQARGLARRRVSEIMSPLPGAVNENANLLEVACLLASQPQDLLLVRNISRVTGIITPLDLVSELREAVEEASQESSKGASYE